jgi:tetratricopeptide (TPR) repeat protein
LRWGLGLLYTITLIGGTIGSLYGLIGKNLPIIASSFADDLQIRGMTPVSRKEYYRTKWQRELQANTAIIDRDPNNINAYRQQLRLHRMLQDDRGQMQDLDRLIMLEPNKSEYLKQRLVLHTKLKQYRAALLDTDLILKLDSKAKDYIHDRRGKLYVELGNTDLAIASYSTHLRESSTSRYGAYLERSKLYSQKGERKLALADLDLAIASEPKFATLAYTERAKLREQIGDRSGAKTDRQKATEIDAENERNNDY